MERFAERWDAKYPAISPSWLEDWDHLTVLCDYPPVIRRVIYTTNAIELLHYSLRKRLKTQSLPERRGDCQIALSRVTTRGATVDAADSGLDSCTQSVRDPIR